jgi:D-glycero-D-manno-heptose 1,7-bisphosphate phosphatase
MGKHEMSRRAVFLDRDGVLNRPVVREGRPYPPQRVDEFALYDGVAEACTMLRDAGFLLIVVTNQPDVGRGTQSRAVVEAMHAKLRAALPALDGIEICFHAGSEFGESCDCRKPKAGMLLRAAAAHGIDLAKSYLYRSRVSGGAAAKARFHGGEFERRGGDYFAGRGRTNRVARFARFRLACCL